MNKTLQTNNKNNNITKTKNVSNAHFARVLHTGKRVTNEVIFMGKLSELWI